MIALPANIPGYDTAMLMARANPTPSVDKTLAAKAPDEIAEKAKDFEAMFISEMLNHMFSGLEVDPMFGGGHGEEMFRSMMVQEYGKLMTEGPNSMGIADSVQKLMLEVQQKENGR